jgi:hypothetical protein
MALTVEAGFDELLLRQRLKGYLVILAESRSSALQAVLKGNFNMAEKAFKTGSYARGTICSGQKDIDLMAPLDYPTYKSRYDNDSQAFFYYVRDKLNRQYRSTRVSSRQVAVLIDFEQITPRVVTCFRRSGGGYLMPNGNGGWASTNPNYHTEIIAAGDRMQNGRLKPLIRLIKAWNFANGAHLRSFHIELLVYKMSISKFTGVWPDVVSRALGAMASLAKSNCEDPWNPATNVDDYLSTDERNKVIQMLLAHEVAALEAEESRKKHEVRRALEQWSNIYPSIFPAYG